jgi:uncharacterized protein (DUF58 family)
MSTLESLLPPRIKETLRRSRIRINDSGGSDFVGQYISRFKGTGLNFTELREYSAGDDIRRIDWKSSARNDRTYVKSYEEERQLRIMACVDVSSSLSHCFTPIHHQHAVQAAASLAFLARESHDEFGLSLFGDGPLTATDPSSTKVHWHQVTQLLHSLNSFTYSAVRQRTGTDFRAVTTLLKNKLRRPSLVFIISDFITPDHEAIRDCLKHIGAAHKIICMHISPSIESWLPRAGLTRVMDSETGISRIINSSSEKMRSFLTQEQLTHRDTIASLCAAHRGTYVTLQDDVGQSLMKFLRRTSL